MSNLQKQFEDFHNKIRLSDDDGKANLPEKRELLVKDLKDGLKRYAEKNDTDEVLKDQYIRSDMQRRTIRMY